MEKTISLAMTTYNGERFLRAQLDSIYTQTKVPDEVIVCDDGSTDNTLSILEEYHQNKGLIYYVNKSQLGVNDNFYKAISLCSGDYIALSDQDDVWLPTKIEQTYKKLLEIDDGNPCVVSSQCKDIDINGNVLGSYKIISDSSGYAASLLGVNNSQGCSLMLNKSLVNVVLANKDKKASFKKIMFDRFISYTAVMLGHKYNLGERLMLYRHHDKNVWSKAFNKPMSFKEKIRHREEFPHFIPNSLFVTLSEMYDCYKPDIKDRDIHELLKKIGRINGTDSFFKRLCIIFTIKEYSFWERIKIIVLSIAQKMLKIIF